MDKRAYKKILVEALVNGGDFAEIYEENTTKNVIEMTSNQVSMATSNNIYGVGLRVLSSFNEVYGYTNDVSKEGLLRLARKLASAKVGPKVEINFELKPYKINNKHKIKTKPLSVSSEVKVSYLKKISTYVLNYSPLIKQALVSLMDETQKIKIINSQGKIVNDVRYHTRIMLTVVAEKDGRIESSRVDIGRHMGFELIEKLDIETFAHPACEGALTMLNSPDMVGQELPVVLHNGFGGVILHEACGHSLEATSVAKGLSVFCNKLNEPIASSLVTAIDDGTIQNGWGSANVDDEGNLTKRNILIENGILKSYLVDYKNAKRMNHDITGCSRRQSYRFSPTSRMSNTFIAPGKSTFEEIIQATKYGLFAKKMGGGSVNPVTGEFQFAVLEGYMIENGKITHPVKGATLVGSGKDTLMKIDMVGNNLSFGQGMCGSISGSIPADCGQPTIRISSMIVGGKGGK